MIGRRLAAIATIVCASSVSAFAPAQQHSSSRIANTELNIFGGLKDAFSNDDSLGKVQNAGLTGGPKINENVSINGKPVNAVVGQKVSQVAVSSTLSSSRVRFHAVLYRSIQEFSHSFVLVSCDLARICFASARHPPVSRSLIHAKMEIVGPVW